MVVFIPSTHMGDLLDLFNNKLFNEDLYSLFDKQSINNKIAYYNFYVYTLQLQKYCYDESIFTKEELDCLELKY